jgi:hypothetical protein
MMHARMKSFSDEAFDAFLHDFVEMTANVLNKKEGQDSYTNTVYWIGTDGKTGIACLNDESDPETIPDAISHHDLMIQVCTGLGAEKFGKSGKWPIAIIFAGEAYGCISFWACTFDKRTRAAMIPITKDKNGRLIPGDPVTAECPSIERHLAACLYKAAWDRA